MNYHDICTLYSDKPLPAALIEDINLDTGGGLRDGTKHVCFMQMVSWLGGEKNTDHPACASRVLAEFCIIINDGSGLAMRRALRGRATAMLNTASYVLEGKRVLALLQAVGTNLGEMLSLIKEPDQRVVPAALVEKYNAALLNDDVFNVIAMINQIKFPKQSTERESGRVEKAIICLGENLILATDDEDLENVVGLLAETVFRDIDSFFDTHWHGPENLDPTKPGPGARALAALDKAIAVKIRI